MRKIILAAIASNRCIGNNGQLPWHISEDLKRFKKQTTNKSVIMGRKTFESIGKPLPNRYNIVLTRNVDSSSLISLHKNDPNVSLASSLDDAFYIAEHVFAVDEVFIIGGAQIYELAMYCADELRLTLIDKPFAGDAFFPQWPLDREWNNAFSEKTEQATYVTYVKEKLLVSV